jgi:hypothetical protein
MQYKYLLHPVFFVGVYRYAFILLQNKNRIERISILAGTCIHDRRKNL